MDKNLQILKKLYEELGINPSVEDLSKRLILQKVVFLAQTAGIPLGHSFNWYVKGPYSPSLASSYYELQDYLGDEVTLEFNDDVKETLRTLQRMISKHQHEGQIDPDWVEALGSIAFLINRSDKTQEQAFEVMERVKKHISSDMRNEAVAELRQNAIIH